MSHQEMIETPETTTIQNPKGALPPVTIKEFADTGHHVHFIPLYCLEGDESILPDSMRRHLEENQQYMQVLNTQDEATCRAVFDAGADSWRDVHGKPWIRYRVGRKKWCDSASRAVTLAGIWLAVETSLGSSMRGYVYQTRPPTTEERRRLKKEGEYRPPTVYAHEKGSDLRETLLALCLYNGELKCCSHAVGTPLLNVSLAWQMPAVKEPVDVSLVIDLGNSRTTVLALQEKAGMPVDAFRQNCKPVKLGQGSDVEKAGDEKVESAIVDSWFVLRQPIFGKSSPDIASGKPVTCIQEEWQVAQKPSFLGKKNFLEEVVCRVPHLFVENSPAVLGAEATDLLGEGYTAKMMEKGGRVTQSSPKRYYWDYEPLGLGGLVKWSMILRPWDSAYDPDFTVCTPSLATEVLRFMPESGEDWDVANPPNTWPDGKSPTPFPTIPCHPRSATLTWMILALIESAWRQVNHTGSPLFETGFCPRRLAKIIGIYPSGWTEIELDLYRRKWQEAINIFALTHLAPGVKPPELEIELDEAVASQLPIIFSEIDRMAGNGERWIAMVGRKRGDDVTVRVMNLDIGGGTTDVAIVEYQDLLPGVGVDLVAKTLYRDSISIGGDDLLRRIVERIILPALATDGMKRDIIEEKMTRVLEGTVEETRRARWVRLCLVPLAKQFLSDLAHGVVANRSPSDVGVVENDWKDLMGYLDLAQAASVRFSCNPEWINRIIRELFATILVPYAAHAAAYGADLLLLSGKPSELPEIRALLEMLMPFPPERIVTAKDYPAGDWYPFGDQSIRDAKSVTAVGAALYRALNRGIIPGWKVRCDTLEVARTRNQWWTVNSAKFKKDGTRLLAKDEDEGQSMMMTGTIIGRRQNDTAVVEPVYMFRWKRAFAKNNVESMVVHIQRVAGNPENGFGEVLKLKNVSSTSPDGSSGVTLDQVELVGWPCPDANFFFWQDTGKLDQIDWEFITQENTQPC